MSQTKQKNFTLYPLFWLAVCFAFGILTAKIFTFGWQISLAICLISAVVSLFFIKRQFAIIFLSVAFVAIGAFIFQFENQTVSPNRLKNLLDQNKIISGDSIEIEGVLRGKPELAIGGIFFELKAEKAIYKSEEVDISGNVRLFAPIADEQFSAEYEQLNLNYGSRIRVACNLRREEKFQNPGAISYKKILDDANLDATANIKSPLLIEKISDEKNFAPLAWIYEQRQNLIVEFHKKFSVSTAGVLIASLLGNDHFLDKKTAEIFREGGTFHVLVISGLHITFIGGLTLLFVRFFTRKRLWQFLIATAFLWSYSLAVGANVPVVRAAIMFTILLFSLVIYRRGSLLNTLGASVLILLIWRPNDLFAPSFQLTILSVLAIVACAFPLIEKLRAVGSWSPSAKTPFPPNVSRRLKRFCEMLYWRENVWERDLARQIWTTNIFKSPYLKLLEAKGLQGICKYIFEAILVSVIVQIWLLPPTILYFHRISIFGIFLNIWVGFWIALESFAAIIAVFISQISETLALPIIKLTEIFNWFLLSIPQVLTENYWASFRLPHYSGAMKAVYFLYFAPIILLAIWLNKWNPFALIRFQISKNLLRLTFSSTVIFLILILFHPFSAPRPDGKLRVDFLDVGQGDSALITFPNGETMLVDGGGRRSFEKIKVRNDFEEESFEPDAQNIGETVVSAFLWEKGYDKVDYILATHADSDHIQGLSDVAKNFRVRAAFFGRTPFADEDFSELFTVLEKRKIGAIKISRGNVLTFGDVKIEVLYPKDSDDISNNNNSIVLRIIYENRKILLTGDIEKESENELLQNPQMLQSDVIKVAHHGSRTSSTQNFINAVRANIAIIPVGKNSPFGHPHEEVLERWKNSNAKILTTGERGTVTILTDGKDLQIETFLP